MGPCIVSVDGLQSSSIGDIFCYDTGLMDMSQSNVIKPGSFQLFNEPTILSDMVGNTGITNHYTPNMYIYNLAFTGSQQGYAAALAIVMAIITIAIAYAVQIRGLREAMGTEGE